MRPNIQDIEPMTRMMTHAATACSFALALGCGTLVLAERLAEFVTTRLLGSVVVLMLG